MRARLFGLRMGPRLSLVQLNTRVGKNRRWIIPQNRCWSSEPNDRINEILPCVRACSFFCSRNLPFHDGVEHKEPENPHDHSFYLQSLISLRNQIRYSKSPVIARNQPHAAKIAVTCHMFAWKEARRRFWRSALIPSRMMYGSGRVAK